MSSNMSSRLAFQTQLASIMEVLANAAVAEICKLVDDDYAVVSLQMSQCQRENKALKRKLHLLELKLARANADRRLREGITSGSRPRAMISGGERGRESSTGGMFERQVTLWSNQTALGDTTPSSPPVILPNSIHTQSPDVQLVELDEVMVKEEKMESLPDVEESKPLTDSGELERVNHSSAGTRLEDQNGVFASSRKTKASRGVETDEDADVVLVKVEEANPNEVERRGQDGRGEAVSEELRGVPSSDETMQSSKNELCDLQESGRVFPEVSYGHSSLWTNGGVCNGDPGQSSFLPTRPQLPSSLIGSDSGSCGRGLAPENSRSFHSFPFELPVMNVSEQSGPSSLSVLPGSSLAPSEKANQKGPMRKLYICTFCGKQFPAPANLESHLRTHTGERPYGCGICGKRFSQFWNMKIHRNIHTGERPYQCPLCPERFSDPSNLKKHQKRHHMKDLPQPRRPSDP